MSFVTNISQCSCEFNVLYVPIPLVVFFIHFKADSNVHGFERFFFYVPYCANTQPVAVHIFLHTKYKGGCKKGNTENKLFCFLPVEISCWDVAGDPKQYPRLSFSPLWHHFLWSIFSRLFLFWVMGFVGCFKIRGATNFIWIVVIKHSAIYAIVSWSKALCPHCLSAGKFQGQTWPCFIKSKPWFTI